MIDEPLLNVPIYTGYVYLKAEVIWMVRNEMARSVEDVLSRRMRLLFLDTKLAIKLAPEIAEIMAEELKKDKSWTALQVSEFNTVAKRYLTLG